MIQLNMYIMILIKLVGGSYVAEKVLHSRINEIIMNDEMRWELIELHRSAIKHGKKAAALPILIGAPTAMAA